MSLEKLRVSPIYLMWTSGVSATEVLTVKQGVLDVVSTRNRNDIGLWSQEEYDSHIKADDIRQVILRNRPLNKYQQLEIYTAQAILERRNIFKDTHRKILIVEDDLTADADGSGAENMLFGDTVPTTGSSIVSLSRFRKISPKEAGLASIRRVVRHETGHLFGLVSRDSGTLDGHCSNICTMRQVGQKENANLLREFWDQTLEEHRKQIMFCGDCTQELSR